MAILAETVAIATRDLILIIIPVIVERPIEDDIVQNRPSLVVLVILHILREGRHDDIVPDIALRIKPTTIIHSGLDRLVGQPLLVCAHIKEFRGIK